MNGSHNPCHVHVGEHVVSDHGIEQVVRSIIVTIHAKANLRGVLGNILADGSRLGILHFALSFFLCIIPIDFYRVKSLEIFLADCEIVHDITHFVNLDESTIIAKSQIFVDCYFVVVRTNTLQQIASERDTINERVQRSRVDQVAKIGQGVKDD
jgi:hypothetical protein